MAVIKLQKGYWKVWKKAILEGPSSSTQLSTQIARFQSVQQYGLLVLLQTLWFLVRQGITIHGHIEE